MEKDPSLLESPHRLLRSAGEAGRFPEPVPDGAGKDDPLDTAQVDPVTDTGLLPSCEGEAFDTATLDDMSQI